MINITEKEMQMLLAFYTESIDCCGYCDDEENMSWNNADDLQQTLGWDKQAIGGVMASLLEKNIIIDSGESARGDRLNDFFLNTWSKAMPQIVEAYENRNN